MFEGNIYDASDGLGIAVIGGVVAGTVLGVLLVPVFYVMVAYKDPPRAPRDQSAP